MSYLLTQETYEKASFEGWQAHFAYIFGDLNKHRTSLGIWGRVLENMSMMAMLIRTGDLGDAVIRLSHIFCWVCACASKENMALDDIIWQKYPYVCPYCKSEGISLACNCSPRKAMLVGKKPKPSALIRQLKQYGHKNKGKKPVTLDEWVNMFEKIYGDRVYLISIEAIVFHLSEEVGEVTQGLRKERAYGIKRIVKGNIDLAKKLGLKLGLKGEKGLTKKNVQKYEHETKLELELEMADIVSQLCALAIKLRYISEAVNKHQEVVKVSMGTTQKRWPEEFSLSREIIREYEKGCTTCKEAQCICPSIILP